MLIRRLSFPRLNYILIMKRFYRYFALIILISSVFSCNLSKIEEFEVGKNFVESNSGMILIDTMQVITSTVQGDSIITNNLSSILIGEYKNSFTGTVTCNPFFEITNGSFSIGNCKLFYDSLVIRMNYNGYSIGDTTKLFTFDLRQLSEALKKRDDGYLYNTSLFQISTNSLGEARIYPQPHSKKNIYIRLSDQFGEELFNKITDKIDTVENSTLFKEYFKGIGLISHENSAAVGFNKDSISLRIYYHSNSLSTGTDTKYYFSFPFNASGIWYNQINYYPTGSLLASIDKNSHELSSSSTSNQTMVQGGSSIYTKIRIPGVNYLKGYGKNLVFTGAQIYLTPLKGSYQKANSLPDSLAVYNADRKNRITSQLQNSAGAVYAIKVAPEKYDELPYYRIDITPFFTSEINDPGETENSIFIGPLSSQSGTTVNPVVFAPDVPGKEIVKMTVFCYTD